MKDEVEDERNFKELLTSIETKNYSNSIFFNKKWMYIAASIAILITMTLVFIPNKPLNNEQLYTAYFSPHTNTFAPIERNKTSATILEKAFLAYENNEFEKALILFEETKETNNTAIQFYKASSYMALNNIEKALPLLEKVGTSKDVYANYAHWYLALCYLKKNQLQNSKSHLEIIVTNSYYPHKKAKELLNEIR